MSDEDILINLGMNLKRCRQLARLTQERLASKAGITAKYISEIENGIRNPSLEVLHKVAEALRVDITELVSFADATDCEYRLMINRILKKKDDKALHKILRVMQIVFEDAH